MLPWIDTAIRALTTLAAIGAAFASVAAWLTSLRNSDSIQRSKDAIQEVHISLNSRLTELLTQIRASAHAEGKAEAMLEQAADKK